ncbi:hypothetical protein H2202_008364 [Exophiala xenobiotica]|nr:hypothetical protein H2202_008364 [Exophiala xenobiotica]KAK5205659.1 hypothetical protein LTR41_008727 [Exophiala xenobiotica]KAK5230470.1 hypothetical protein LTR47_007612 [Exophiala xenobiotica]KAK5244462.1 hypothetical protein LTS06_009977 [Exophiala xenobiotica]KAK5280044.1 hypothetical protein LTR40_006938 [Exophiala xenobiotica]
MAAPSPTADLAQRSSREYQQQAQLSQGPQPATQWHFISARPTSKLEERRNKALVRAHVSRRSWAQVITEPEQRPTPQTSYRSHAPETDRVTVDLSGVANLQHQERLRRSSRPRRKPPPPIFSAISSANFSLDPFETYPSDLPHQFIDRLMPSIINQTGRLLQPFRLKDRNERWGIFTASWIRAAIHDRAMFHTALFASLFNSRLVETHAAPTREELLCYQISLQEISRMLQDTKLATSDEAVQTVCCMAFHGDFVVKRLRKSPRQGPFQTLQMLDLYGGTVSSSTSHTRGMVSMLRAKGGIGQLKIDGLPQIVCYLDIMCANREMARPVFPFVPRFGNPEDELLRIAAACPFLPTLGTGFSDLDRVLNAKQVAPLSTVLRCMSAYTLVLEAFAVGIQHLPALGLLAELRNFVQHSLLSLTPRGSSNSDSVPPLFEMCHTVAIVYSWIVIFPAPVQAMPFHEAAMRIRELLDSDQADSYWTEVPWLMIWIVVMGAIASLGSCEEQGYVRFLSRALQRLNIHSWTVLKGRLEMFLWYSRASDLDGLDLWQEIVQSRI